MVTGRCKRSHLAGFRRSSYGIPLLHLVSGNVVAVLALAGTAIFTARWLGPSDRGLLVLITSVTTMTSIFATFGYGTEIRRHIAQGRNVGLATTVLVLSLISGLLAYGAVYSYFLIIGQDIKFIYVLLAALLGTFVTSSMLTRDALLGLSQYRFVSLAQPSTWVSQLAALFLIDSLWQLNLLICLILQIISAGVLTTVLSLRLAIDNRNSRTSATKSPISWRLAITALIPLFTSQYFLSVDRIVLGSRSQAAEVAYFSIAATFATPVTLVASSIGQIRQTHAAQGSHTFNSARVRMATMFAFIAAGLIAAMAPVMIAILLGNEYADSLWPTWIYILGSPLYAYFILWQSRELGDGRYLRGTVVGLSGICTSFLGIWILAPRFGAAGAAIASLIAFTIMAVSVIIVTRHDSRQDLH